MAQAIRRNNIYTISKVYHILLRMKTYFQNLIMPEKVENSLKMIITWLNAEKWKRFPVLRLEKGSGILYNAIKYRVCFLTKFIMILLQGGCIYERRT